MRFLIFLAIIFSVITMLLIENTTVFGQAIPTTDELLNKAFELNKEGKYNEGVSILNGILVSEPDNITALHYRSTAHIGLEQFDKAKADIERIFALRPQPSGGILYNYGVALSGTGDYEEAIQFFDMIDDKDHNYFNAKNMKGIALLELSRFDEAIENFDIVLKDNPDNVKALLHKGLALSNLGNYGEALNLIYNVLSIDPKNVRARNAEQSTLNLKGLSLLYDESKPEEAITYFKKALANDPRDPNAAAYLSMAESELTKKQLINTVNSVYVAWGVSLGGIAFSIYAYFYPRKQKER